MRASVHEVSIIGIDSSSTSGWERHQLFSKVSTNSICTSRSDISRGYINSSPHVRTRIEDIIRTHQLLNCFSSRSTSSVCATYARIWNHHARHYDHVTSKLPRQEYQFSEQSIIQMEGAPCDYLPAKHIVCQVRQQYMSHEARHLADTT